MIIINVIILPANLIKPAIMVLLMTVLTRVSMSDKNNYKDLITVSYTQFCLNNQMLLLFKLFTKVQINNKLYFLYFDNTKNKTHFHTKKKINKFRPTFKVTTNLLKHINLLIYTYAYFSIHNINSIHSFSMVF